MPISIGLCSDSDIDRVFTIVSDAFGRTEPYINFVFPNHDSPRGHEQARSRLRDLRNSDPTARLLKAVDNSSGDIIGQANWLICEKTLGNARLRNDLYWDDDEDRIFAQELYDQFKVHRTAFVEACKGPVLGIQPLPSLYTFVRSGLEQ